MSRVTIAVSIELGVLNKIDHYVQKKVFENRSQAIQAAVSQVIEQLKCKRLADECIKLDVAFEQQMATDGVLFAP